MHEAATGHIINTYVWLIKLLGTQAVMGISATRTKSLVFYNTGPARKRFAAGDRRALMITQLLKHRPVFPVNQVRGTRVGKNYGTFFNLTNKRAGSLFCTFFTARPAQHDIRSS
jgi:hypothetical protein